MRPYEVMVIFDADLEEETIRAAVDRSIQLIESKGAELGHVDFWGKRRFAYELKHRWEGYYVVLQAKAEPAAMDELHRTLSLADEVLRHKVLRIPEQVYGPPKTAAPRRRTGGGLRPGRGPTRRGGTRWPTTPSPSWATSPAIPRSATPPAAPPNASFGVAVNRRWQNRQTNEWEERTSFFNVVCWREMAENVTESLGKGTRVVVTGRLEQRSWETENGEKRSVVEIVADEVGPSLRWATAEITRNERRGGGGGRRLRRRRRRRRWRRRRRRRPTGRRRRARAGVRRLRRRALLERSPKRDPVGWHETMARPQQRGAATTASSAAQEEASRSSTPSRSTGSTTRTSTCSAGSCRSGPRSAPVGSPATTPSSSARSRGRSASRARWRCCPTASGR